MKLHYDLEGEVARMLDNGFQQDAQPFQRRRAAVRFVLESADELASLHAQGLCYSKGAPREKLGFDKTTAELPGELKGGELLIGGHQVMQDWERPLMQACANACALGMTGNPFRWQVLEIGFGLGISATMLQAALRPPTEHVIVDCNPEVLVAAKQWAERQRYPDCIKLVGDYWEQAVPKLDLFDAILFDPYSTSWEAISDYDESEPHKHMLEFFPVAASHLREGGILTYFTGEVNSLGRNHQRALLRHFRSFEVGVVRGMEPPVGCQYWWSDSMAVVAARK